jgi:hypothetical protein
MRNNMAKKIRKQVMVKVGNHLIDPTDVACISKLRSKRLYIVRLKSQPNMEFPIWVGAHEIDALLEYFEIKVNDVPEEDT